MAKGLLITYAGYPYTPSSLAPDNGLANLAGALISEGHQVRIMDFGTVSVMRRLYPPDLSSRVAPIVGKVLQAPGAPPPETQKQLADMVAALEQYQEAETRQIAEEVVQEVRRERPDFVGFKLWNGDGFSGSVIIAERLRQEFPQLKLYAGGPHATWFQELIYRHTRAFDALAYGEAEHTILALADHAAGKVRLADIPGLVHAESGPVQVNPPAPFLEMDGLPTPIYDEDVYPAMVGDEKLKLVVIDDSRGCPYGCGFCTHPVESGRKLRAKSAQRLVDDIERVINRYGLHAFRFAGSSTPGRLLAEAAREILKRGLKVRYASFGHFRSAEPERFRLMRQSGLMALFFGAESGCQELLDRAVGKGLNLQRVKETVRAAKAAGIFVACSMIVPLPFETEATLQESLRFLLELRPDSVPVQFPGLLPLTPWLNEPDRFGIEVNKDQYLFENVAYKFKLLLPPAFWSPLPYKINGMGFQEFTALTAGFSAQLEAEGLLLNLSDDNALIAELAGMTPREYRDAARLWCVTGNAEAMQEMVRRANRSACQSA